ncbi:hypothetical protein TWF481_000546 [Arthrobotrys musiformis]|uniref:Uncharacterized protein n=1 Tax=Arthrobotrys musiformis TaxID=47236 RepID=A0AAV9WP30_9PEZI
MERVQPARPASPVPLGPSSMQLSSPDSGSPPLFPNNVGPLSKIQFLRSKDPSSRRMQTVPWKRPFPFKNSGPGANLREDHPIYHESFYTSHFQSINNLWYRLNRLNKWAGQTKGVRFQSRDCLQLVDADIMTMVKHPTSLNVRIRIKSWELQIRAVAKDYKQNEREDSQKFKEWKYTRDMLSRAKSNQKEMTQVVIKNMPKFFWRSSAPLKRMLEIEKQFPKLEASLARAKTGLTAILSTDIQISNMFKKCNEGLVGVITVLMEKTEEQSPLQVAERPRAVTYPAGNMPVANREVIAPADSPGSSPIQQVYIN